MPKLSIVVPTRERADTLAHTLRTLVAQDYDDCEIVISDNCSEDNTKEIVESFEDSRIRYIKTNKRVSMSDNWEFALHKIRGEYVTYIGDDDGFVPGGIGMAMEILGKTTCGALIWDKVEYCWPDHIDSDLGNWFSFKVEDRFIQMAEGRDRLGKVMKFKERYTRLPCLYNGIVKTSLLRKITDLSTNKTFFNSISPDVYSGIALSLVVGKYLISNYPFSLNGASRHSNGTSLTRSEASDVDSPKAKFNSENTREYDPRVKMAPSVAACVMGEYLFAQRYLPSLDIPKPNWKRYVIALIKSANNSLRPEEVLQSASHTVKSVGLRVKVPGQLPPSVESGELIGFHVDSFSFKAPLDMVANIYDACQLVSGMLPSAINISSRSPIAIFFRRVKEYFISQAKILYRSFYWG